MAFFALPDAARSAALGLTYAYPHIAVRDEPLFLRSLDRHPGRRVGLVSGGGSGHEPLHVGLLGRGGLDAVAPGAISASPHARQITAASMAAAVDDKVLHIVKNYTGDRVNFGLAAEQLREAGIAVETVLVDDDLATAGSGAGRRGTGATLIVEKLLGAAADQGTGLAELAELGARIVSRSRSLAVTARAHTSHTTRKPAFSLGRDYDFGAGIHGERAPHRVSALRPTTYIVRKMLDELLDPGSDTVFPDPREGVILLVNGLGGTPELELLGISALAVEILAEQGVTVAAVPTGSYVTAQDTAGISLTLTALDPGWLDLWSAPSQTPLRLPGPAGSYTPPNADAAPRSSTTPVGPGSRTVLERLSRLTTVIHPGLTRLDQAVGDGDFGDNWASGVHGALNRAQRDNTAGMATLADEFRENVGGTSGPLLGLVFSHLSRALGDEEKADVAALATASTEALAAISRVGGAHVGDCTLLDALAPAADALTTAAAEQNPAALTSAARAAATGAGATAEMRSRRGRSSYVGDDHTLGVPDPGAIAIAALYITMAEVYEPQHARHIPSLDTLMSAGS
ncbi:dihydroxyacetone kinase subunit DhaK [Streptomyces halstedii]|uniref:dihydroxyacetone kinase subunit DhaK n=1 Tax=Streptomyces halstedii TaxID=1944 RepID=UPI00345FECDC